MSIFPDFSNVNNFVVEEFNRRMDNTQYVSSLNSWIRVASGVGKGLIMQSNADFALLSAAGGKQASFYGSATESGTLGVDWSGGAVKVGGDVGLRPSPIVSSFECDEGGGTATLSRKATFKITAFTQKQCDMVCRYFLEPGFTVFIEWGWNKPSAFVDFSQNLSADYVVSFNSIKVLQNRRTKSKGLYDNYLGFITGGSVAASGDKWEITVSCTGFPELPAYLMVSDNVLPKQKYTEKMDGAVEFSTSLIEGTSDLGTRRFMQMFNQLPSNRRSTKLQSKLFKSSNMLLAINYVNFDEAVRENFQSVAGDSIWTKAKDILSLGLSEGTTTVGAQDSYVQTNENGEPVATQQVDSLEIPNGTKLIGEEKYIRFGAVIEVINSLGAAGYVIGTKRVNFKIESRDCVCSAFKQIFSTDKTKLFIPNPNTPKFSIAEALNKTTPQTDFSKIQNNAVEAPGSKNPKKGNSIKFPYPSAIVNGKVAGGFRTGYSVGLADAGLKVQGISKPLFEWGFLDDLYVNFDFVKGIVETKNFFMKDALYQILNGMSSAAGSLWDFQIIEQSNSAGTDVILKIVDLNFVSKQKNPLEGIMALPLTGPNSVFLDASLDLDISSGKMNQVIGSRLGAKANSSSPSTTGALFATGLSDMVLNKIAAENVKSVDFAKELGVTDTSVKTEEKGNVKNPDGTIQQTTTDKLIGKAAAGVNAINGALGGDPELLATGAEQNIIDEQNAEIEAAKEKSFQLFLEKVGIYPKVEFKKKDTLNPTADGFDLYKYVYVGALNDLTVFENLKLGYEVVTDIETDTTGPIMPIEFTFSVHGISGMKRGDKFRILGLPSKYSTCGFFQVMSIKHTIEGMVWKTEIKGGFRQVSLATAKANVKVPPKK
jgi:hypothetical protein